MIIKSAAKLIPLLILLILSLSAAQCQPAPAEPTTILPQPTALLSSPTPPLYPPIEPGDGSDLIDHLLETGIIRVGIRVWPEATFSPPAFRGFSNAETGGAMNGFEVDIARLVAQGLGLELELVEAYPPAIASGDWRGQWDIAIASLVPFDQPPDDARAALLYSRPYAYMPMGILIPDETHIQTFNDLSGRRVGVLEHSPYQRLLTPEGQALTVNQQPLLADIPAGIQPAALSNLPKAIRQMEQFQDTGPEPEAQIDAIFGPSPILEEAIKSDVPVKLVAPAENLGLQPLAIAAIPRDNLKADRLIQEINIVLDRLDRQGTLAEIYLRWYEQDLSRDKRQLTTSDDQDDLE